MEAEEEEKKAKKAKKEKKKAEKDRRICLGIIVIIVSVLYCSM